MSSPSEPPFRSIAIVGLGLIGGSIALAVRERWPAIRVIGVDSQAVLAHALGARAIDSGVEAVADLPDTDLAILAAPVQQNVALLATATRAPLITDVGGTKRAIVEAAQGLPASRTFVGGHPLGGGERGGFAFARPDLFAGRAWIFTPTPSTPEASVAQLSRFAAGLGARPEVMTAAEHDRVMAFVSHLPQLTASALMGVVGSAAQGEGLGLAGKGLLDTTRLAASPADVWRDISATNADQIGEALDRLIAELTRLRADIGTGTSLEAIFTDAARWRAELMKRIE